MHTRTLCFTRLFFFFFLKNSDDLQNREHCWNRASLCDKNRTTEGQQQLNSNGRGGSGGIGILRRVHRCLSSGAIPIPASMTIASPSNLHPATEPTTFYQSYSCDDLYLVSDLTQQPPISEQQEEPPDSPPTADRRPRRQPEEANELVFQEIDLTNPSDAVCTVYQ